VLLIINFIVLFELTPEPQTNGINVSTEISLTKNRFDSNQANDSPKNHQSDKNCPIFLVSMSQAPSPQDFFTPRQIQPAWGIPLVLKQPVILILFIPIIILILFFSIFYQSSRTDSDEEPLKYNKSLNILNTLDTFLVWRDGSGNGRNCQG
jgi:hypothetical protein